MFKCKTDLRQDDAFFPLMFNLALEKVVRDTQNLKEMDTIGPYILFAYADDIISIGEFRHDV